MAGIKQPLLDIMARLSTHIVPNKDGGTMPLYVRIWNSQIEHAQQGEIQQYPRPAAFVEVIADVTYEQIGVGFQSADLGINIHIEHEYYDATDGTFEQDLPVLDLRDDIKALMSLYEPTACGPMVQTTEAQDFDHSNIYHLIIGFVCNFTDSKGSKYDPDSGKLAPVAAITGLETDITPVAPTTNPVTPFSTRQYQI